MRVQLRFTVHDIALWMNLIILHFGFVVLATPATASLRGPICGLSILFSVCLFFYSVKRNETAILSFWIIVCTGIAAFLGFINGASLTGEVLDVCVSLSIFCAIELCYESEETIYKYLRFVAVSAIATFAVLYISNPITLGQVLSRGAIWTGTYYCTSMFWAAPFMLIYAYLKRKPMLLPLTYFVVAGIINILYLKRQFIVEAFALILILIVFSMFRMKSIKKTLRFLFIILIALGIGYFVLDYVFKLGVSDIVNQIIFRFEHTEETGFVRFTEMSNYFSNANAVDVLMGKGFGVAHYGLGKENTAFHLGVANLIYKYGVFLIPVIIHFMVKTIRSAFDRDKEGMILISAIIISLVSIPEFFLLSNFWLTTPCYLWFWFCLISCRYRQEESIDKIRW